MGYHDNNYKDFIYSAFTYNINKYNITYIYVFVKNKVIYK